MTQLLSMLAALVAMATGLSMLQDAPASPADRTALGWFRHVARLVLLVSITACSGVVLCVEEARAQSLYQAVFSLALACFMAMQSPCPWWAYVLKGRGHASQRPPPQPLGPGP